MMTKFGLSIALITPFLCLSYNLFVPVILSIRHFACIDFLCLPICLPVCLSSYLSFFLFFFCLLAIFPVTFFLFVSFYLSSLFFYVIPPIFFSICRSSYLSFFLSVFLPIVILPVSFFLSESVFVSSVLLVLRDTA